MKSETKISSERIQLHSPRFQNRKRNIIRTIKKIFEDRKNIRILDAGCGAGNFMHVVEKMGYEVEGIDVDPNRIESAKQYANGPTYLGDLVSFPFTQKYDLIICGEILEHIREDTQALLNLRKALKLNGWIIITVPNNPDAWSIDDELAGHIRRYNKTEIVDKLIKCGYKNIKVRYIGWPLINLFMKVYTKTSRKNLPQKINPIVKIALCLYSKLEIVDDFFNNPAAEKMLISCQRI